MGIREDFNRNLAAADSIQNAIGAQPPLGYWDPLGLLKNADQARFNRLREVERKHGRISMLAVLGHLVTTYGYRLDGEIAYGIPFSSIKSGLAAFDQIPAAGGIQLVSTLVAIIGGATLNFYAARYCTSIFLLFFDMLLVLCSR